MGRERKWTMPQESGWRASSAHLLFFAHLLGRSLLRSCRASVPYGASFAEMQGLSVHNGYDSKCSHCCFRYEVFLGTKVAINSFFAGNRSRMSTYERMIIITVDWCLLPWDCTSRQFFHGSHSSSNFDIVC